MPTATALAASKRRAPDPPGTGEAGLEFDFTDADFARVRKLIHERAGIALGEAKRSMVYSRLGRRLRARGVTSFADYLALLNRGGSDEWEAFTNALTTNLTSFFREGHHFPVLVEHLRSTPARRPLTIWCTAASTGEEPYTIAMSACEAFDTLRPPVAIIASDIDTDVLATARRGVYPLEKLKSVDAGRKRRFFLRGTGAQEGFARVRPELQALIDFRRINLHDGDWGVPGGLNAIFCRNLLIYFDRPTQARVLDRLAPLLAGDGLFFAGHSESLVSACTLLRSRGRTVYARAPGIPA